jgi:hypothetical protein
MLPVLIALTVPALSAAQPAPPARPRPQMANTTGRGADACAPDGVLIAPAMPMRVVGTYQHGRMLFGPNDPLIIGAGTKQGLRTGQEYVVRRVVHDQFTPMTAQSVLVSIHTAGAVRIVDAQEDMSIATVTQACDGVIAGDYLEAIPEGAAPAAITGGTPDYAHPARLVLADERRQMGTEGTLMLIDRGSDDGVRGGQQLTVFRQTISGGPALDVAQATVLNVRPKTSLVRIGASNDAVYVGDLVALHK